jgi:hypothetical protein
VELFKKHLVVALMMPKSAIKIKKKMGHGAKVDAQARGMSKKLTFCSRMWHLFGLFLGLN